MATTETVNSDFQNKKKVEKNIDDTERIASGIGGGLLAAYGLYRMDLIGLAIAAVGGALINRAADGFCDVYDWLGISTEDSFAADSPQEKPAAKSSVVKTVKHRTHVEVSRVEKSVTVKRPLAEIFEFWRNFENLPQVMSHLEAVKVIDEKRSHWTAKAPLGTSVEWDAEIVDEQKNHYIAWRSVAGADVDNNGSVRFDRAGGGVTKITVIIDFTPPAGAVGAAIASFFGENPEQQLEEDLQKFKETMEGGKPKT